MDETPTPDMEGDQRIDRTSLEYVLSLVVVSIARQADRTLIPRIESLVRSEVLSILGLDKDDVLDVLRYLRSLEDTADRLEALRITRL